VLSTNIESYRPIGHRQRCAWLGCYRLIHRDDSFAPIRTDSRPFFNEIFAVLVVIVRDDNLLSWAVRYIVTPWLLAKDTFSGQCQTITLTFAIPSPCLTPSDCLLQLTSLPSPSSVIGTIGTHRHLTLFKQSSPWQRSVLGSVTALLFISQR